MRNIKTKIFLLAFVFLAGAYQASASACATVDLGGLTGGAVGGSLGLGNNDCLEATNGGLNSWAGVTNDFGLPGGTVIGIIQGLLFWLLALFATLGVLAFVISGIKYLLASADADLAKTAKQNMQWAILGIIVGLSGVIVLTAINAWLAGQENF